MKFLYFIITLFVSCSSVPKEYLTNEDICNYNDPIFKISKDEMTFDVEKYKDTLKKGSIIKYSNKEYKEQYFSLGFDYTFIKADTIKRTEKIIDYYSNGKIMQSSFFYMDGDVPLKKETYYNKQGEITEVIEYQKDYNICWKEAIAIVKKIAKKDIEKYEIKNFRLRAFKHKKTKPRWSVTLINGNKKYKQYRYKHNTFIYFHIDGKTGKNIIKEKLKEKRKKLKYALRNTFNPTPKEYLTNDDICHYNDPIFKITKDEMTFDKIKYDSILSIKGVIYIEEKKYTIEIQNDLIGKTDKQTKLTKWIYYYPNGKIKSVSFFLRNSSSSEIGKETEYNQQGNITKVIDYEKGYKICWAEAIEIVKQIAKKDIKKYKVTGFNLSHTNLNEYPNQRPVWAISLDGNEEYELKDTKVYWIDGITGKYIKTTKIITEHGI